ncbi:hypothetical protein Droror1_Dr00023598 [Drosera rotundifolia]
MNLGGHDGSCLVAESGSCVEQHNSCSGETQQKCCEKPTANVNSLDVTSLGDLSNVVLAAVASTASSFFMHDLSTAEVSSAQDTQDQTRNSEYPEEIITEARNNLLAACKSLVKQSVYQLNFFEE